MEAITRAELYEARGEPLPNGHKAVEEASCLQCGEPFEAKDRKRYCSDRCRERAKVERRRTAPDNGSAPTVASVEPAVRDHVVQQHGVEEDLGPAEMVAALLEAGVGSVVLQRGGWQISVRP